VLASTPGHALASVSRLAVAQQRHSTPEGDRMRTARARRAATTAILVALGTMGVSAVPVAQAAPADDCAAPTRTVTGSTGGATLDVAAGEVVLLTGTQTGGLGSLPAGATLCVGTGASLRPGYVNNPAGTLYVAPGGSATLSWTGVESGFVLDNAGTVTIGGLNVNGYTTLRNAAGADLTIGGSFTPTSGEIDNDGTLTWSAGADLAAGVVLANAGTLTSGGSLTVHGPFENTGTTRITGDLVVDAPGDLHNQCVLETSGGLTNSAGATSTNSGIAAITAAFTNDGAWQQGGTGALSAATLTDTGSVTGFGRYVFTGSTVVYGSFTGDSAQEPILVDVPRTSTPPFFDIEDGPVTNVVRQDITLPAPEDYPAPGCADPSAPPSVDLRVSKAGPATVAEGGAVAYTITVSQDGPDAAEDVVVIDTLPGSLTDVTLDPSGVLTGGQAVWSLGTVPAGTTVVLTVTGTAPSGADVPADRTLVNQVAATTSTADPDPAAAQDSVTTTIDTPVPGPPPTADPAVHETTAGSPVYDAATGSSTVPGVDLVFRLDGGPAEGALVLRPSGVFTYIAAPGYAGEDAFTFVVCDNQTPEQCSAPAVITLIVHPRVRDDSAAVPRGRTVTIPIAANDTPSAVPSTTLVDLPDHGGVGIDPVAGTATYQPGANYLGTDLFRYQSCAAGFPDDCATAVVTIAVIPDNTAPSAPELTLTTTVDAAVSGSPAVSDPDGDLTTLTAVFPPAHGTADLSGTQTTYTPAAGFAGADGYAYTVCDDGQPMLCSTGTVTVLVDPIALDDEATTPAGTPVTVDVLANDRGTVLDPTVIGNPSHGALEPTAAGLAYTPADGFSGVDTARYRICAADGSAACAEATVTVTVLPAAAPVPDDDGTPVTPGVTPPAQDPGTGVLGRTGTEVVGPLVLGALLLGAGALLLLIRRRPGRR
jgi:uncharacterized repeat protein (TIGR01451 family)